MRNRLAKIWMAALLAAIPSAALAAEWIVTPSDGPTLSAVLKAAAPGDRIRLKPGRHDGPLIIDKPVTLDGEGGASIVGNGRGSVITIEAAKVAVRGIEITGSGMNLPTLDSGILAARTATGVIIENNTLTGNLFGIYLHGAKDSLARKNVIVGLKDGRMSEFGSGISIWNAPGGKVIDNDISFGRDGIATMASKKNVFSGNRFRDLRFAIHYMYTNDSVISGNVSTGNSVGYAIMFSNRLKIIDNISDGDRDHGLLLNSANSSTISGNIVRGRLQPADRWTMAGIQDSGHGVKDDAETTGAVEGNRLGPEKCVFIYNANRNKLLGNEFRGCAIGIHFTAGSEGNTMTGNAFIDNRNQVKYVGTRYLDWSVNGRGNYWSDNPAFDLDGDGISDNAYRPNDLMDKVLWTSPQAKILTSSPAVQIIRWAQVQFPALLPGGVVDSHPLMAPARQKDGLQ
ncbi:nitrous oxide reductase family maturation protein NosD [Sinorhizobium meliloti]|nr:nitrous oxide reductase family maturation protein NosD [Sinorhizobium meliloti]MQU92859.1 nitrous oxide reductase family maturation protein NosD [Sinorhizobium meliloti]